MSSELWQLSATELAALIRTKEATPSEITESVLGRCAALDDRLHAFITRTPDEARRNAAAADERARRGDLLGPLDGIPLSIKDLEPTAGIRTTLGSRFFADDVPAADGLVAARLRGAGAVLIGKTNTPHAGYIDMCDNLVADTCVNPWDTSRTPGGSSGGAACAVAAGFGPIAHGTDGAGSIRIPASLCGVVGFKPSFGRVPSAPAAEYWGHRVHHGPLTRTVADAAAVLSVISGGDPRDAVSIDRPPLHADLDAPATRTRVAWSRDLGYGHVEPEVADICEKAALAFAGFGYDVESADPTWADPGRFHRTIYSVGLATALAERARTRPDWIEPALADLIAAGNAVNGVDLRAAEIARGRLYEDALGFFAGPELLLTPTMPMTAWPAEPNPGPQHVSTGSLQPYLRRSFYCYPFNLTGQPAITVPCGTTAAGLPVGLQIVGRWHADEAVLRAAARFEAWRGPLPWPPLVSDAAA